MIQTEHNDITNLIMYKVSTVNNVN